VAALPLARITQSHDQSPCHPDAARCGAATLARRTYGCVPHPAILGRHQSRDTPAMRQLRVSQ